MLKAERSVKATPTCLYCYAHIATCVLLAAKSFRWPAAADWGHWTKFTTVSAKQAPPPPPAECTQMWHLPHRHHFVETFQSYWHLDVTALKIYCFLLVVFFTINVKNVVYYAYFFLFFRCKWSFGFICDWLWQEFSWKLRGVRYIFLQ